MWTYFVMAVIVLFITCSFLPSSFMLFVELGGEDILHSFSADYGTN